MNNSNIYEKITAQIIESLKNNDVPWQKPWIGAQGAVSHTNGRPYSLLNQFLLGRAGEWLTFRQIESEGGKIKKGEKAGFVVFWKFLPKYGTDENGEQIIIGEFPMLKYYNVWHISQVEGIEPKFPQQVFEHQPIENAEKIALDYIEREQLKIARDDESDKACYSPMLDKVTLPKMSQFAVIEEYYSTLFHELTHSTGAKQRLNREGVTNFDFFASHQYSKEELVAELGAAFLVNLAGLDSTKAFNNSVAYIQSWLKALENDPKMIVSAASKAEQAAKFILSGERPSEQGE